MSGRKKKKVAGTEDRIKRHETLCAYQPCGDRLTPARIAEGYQHCSDECYYEHLVDRSDEEDTDPEEDE